MSKERMRIAAMRILKLLKPSIVRQTLHDASIRDSRSQLPQFAPKALLDHGGPLKLASLERAKINTVRHLVISAAEKETSLGGCLVRPICLRGLVFRDGTLH